MTGVGGPRILVVEDDRDFATLTKANLEKRGAFEVDITTDPREAVERTEATDYECIISDYDMPEMDGLELLETVRETDPRIPFILFTGRGSEDVASRAISANVTDYLQKGGGSDTFELLVNRVNNGIEGYQARAALEQEKRLSEWIVQTLPIGLVVHDRNGDVLLTNERANEILGTTDGELNADDYESGRWELREPDGSPVPYDRLPFTRVMDGEDLEDVPYTVHTSDGDVIPIVVSGTRLRNDDGETEAVIIPFRVAERE